ncbi:MAG TPA: hypothetical protein VFU47_15035, partial [Armatimonadota bacterium]|nr:hypothetical protein [Armatimonadota bacterium]
TNLARLYDHSPSGSPTNARVADGVDGQLQIKLSSDDERQFVGYDWGDQVIIPATKRVVFEAIIEFVTLPGANERIWFGLGTELAGILALQQDIELLSRRLGFSVDADGVLEIESDDGTTDHDDETPQNESVTLVAGTQYLFRMDLTDTSRVSYQIADGDGDHLREIGYLDAGELAASDKLQPLCYVQKDSGAGVPEVLVDMLYCGWDRSNK